MRRRIVEPGTYAFVATTNRDGLRGKDRVALPKPPGRRRIGIFGCSQTFGAGVDDAETFASLLGHALPDAELLNFGVSGYGTDQMLLYYETVGRKYDLDVVVLAFAEYQLERNLLRFRSYAKPLFELTPGGELRLTGVPVPAPGALLETGAPPLHPVLDRSALLRWLWRRMELRDPERVDRADSKAWTLTRALIARFAADVRTDGARMVLVNIDRTSSELEAALQELANAEAIRFVDLDGTVRDAERKDTIRLPQDSHFNPAGHRLVADGLKGPLCEAAALACAASPGSGPRRRRTLSGRMHPTIYDAFERICSARRAGRRVLEIGALPKPRSLLNLRALGRASHRVGVNLAPPTRFGSFEILQANANALPFEDASFDTVLSNATLEHDAKFWKSLGEIRRVVRPGGLLVIGIPAFMELDVEKRAQGLLQRLPGVLRDKPPRSRRPP